MHDYMYKNLCKNPIYIDSGRECTYITQNKHPTTWKNFNDKINHDQNSRSMKQIVTCKPVQRCEGERNDK